MTAISVSHNAPELLRIVLWIEAETGLRFPEAHHDTIVGTMRRRSKLLGLGSAQYEELLYRDEVEKGLFFDEIMIGETYFFRDEKQFVALVRDILPVLAREGRSLRLWSATCATGEEAVSLAATIEQVGRNLGFDIDYGIIASDISREALARLEAGRFGRNAFRSDGKAFHPLLERCGEMDGEEWRASPDILARIRTMPLNILSSEALAPDSFDIVFFRNTLVYMSQEHKDMAIERIVHTIRPGGYLFLASPEIPSVRHVRLEVLESSGCFFFRKLDIDALRNIIPALNDPSHAQAAKPRTACRSRMNGEARSPIAASELSQGLKLASARARGSRTEATGGAVASVEGIASAVEAIIEAMHANDFAKAQTLIDEFEAAAGESYLSHYFRACAKKHQGSEAAALELWERARIYEPKFWPALFQAGQAYMRDNPERSATLLEECVAAIEEEGSESPYFAVLEGFDAPTYLRMATTMLARLDKKRAKEE